MGRAGYTEDCDDARDFAMWRGQVASAIRGKRGQAFLRDLERALAGMRVKALTVNALERTDPHLPEEGSVCAIGALGKVRGLELGKLDPDDWETVAAAFGIASPLAREVFYMNDEGLYSETPEQRHARMLSWVRSLIKPAEPA